MSADITGLTESISINDGKCVVVDLQGHSIKKKEADANNKAIFSVSGGTLTIKGNGTLDASETGNICVDNKGGDVTLNGVIMKNKGQVKFDGSKNFDHYPVVKIDGICNTVIIDCELTSTEFNAIATNSTDPKSDGSRLSVIDSKLTGKWAGILITTYADVTIDGCTIVGEEHGAFFRGCNAKISNSKIYCTNTALDTTANAGAWVSDGNKGPYADITFACGGSQSSGFGSYITTGNYSCENVVNKDGQDIKVVVHEPEGGKVNLSGVTATHTCHGAKDSTCQMNSTCGE